MASTIGLLLNFCLGPGAFGFANSNSAGGRNDKLRNDCSRTGREACSPAEDEQHARIIETTKQLSSASSKHQLQFTPGANWKRRLSRSPNSWRKLYGHAALH